MKNWWEEDWVKKCFKVISIHSDSKGFTIVVNEQQKVLAINCLSIVSYEYYLKNKHLLDHAPLERLAEKLKKDGYYTILQILKA
jgi:hypothetical protein